MTSHFRAVQRIISFPGPVFPELAVQALHAHLVYTFVSTHEPCGAYSSQSPPNIPSARDSSPFTTIQCHSTDVLRSSTPCSPPWLLYHDPFSKTSHRNLSPRLEAHHRNSTLPFGHHETLWPASLVQTVCHKTQLMAEETCLTPWRHNHVQVGQELLRRQVFLGSSSISRRYDGISTKSQRTGPEKPSDY